MFELALKSLSIPDEKTVALAIESLEHLYWLGDLDLSTIQRACMKIGGIPQNLRTSTFVIGNIEILCEYLTERAKKQGLDTMFLFDVNAFAIMATKTL
ncbi:MAG TPA: hypothetical protein VGF94_08275 [Kofleriaceae bacterium]